MTTTTYADIQHFFALLYPDVEDGFLVLSRPDPDPTHVNPKTGKRWLRSAWLDLAQTSLARIAEIAATHSQQATLYFGVALQRPDSQPDPYHRGTNAGAYLVPGLWFDLDLGYGQHAASTLPATDAEALAFLASLPAEPSLIVHSGGGLYGYWLFKEPYRITREAEHEAIKTLARHFTYTLTTWGTDHGWTLDALGDLARVLRPVGTINHKYGTVVEVLHDSGTRYNPMDFDWLVDLPEPATTTHAGAAIPGQPDLVAIAEHYGATLERKSKTELAGAHPQHGSSTGDNFNVNVDKGLWHCWRHGTGGDALALIAVCEGLVACDAMQAGALRGETFHRVVAIANSTFQAGITLSTRRAIPDMTQPPTTAPQTYRARMLARVEQCAPTAITPPTPSLVCGTGPRTTPGGSMTFPEILASAETLDGTPEALRDVYREMYELAPMPSELDDILKALHSATKKTLRVLREDWKAFCEARDQLAQAAGARYRNGSTPGAPEHEPPLPLSDYTNALAFVRDHGADVRHCEAWKKWLLWTGTHWSYKVQAPVFQKAKQTIKGLLRQAAQFTDDEYLAWMAHIKRSLSTAAIKAMVESAQNEPGIPLEHEQMNRHPWLLSCLNGTLDLTTGTLRKHAREDLLTECLALAYDASATCPQWEAFLWQILGGTTPEEDTEDMGCGILEERSCADARATVLRDYLQRVFGSGLTGDVSEQDLYVFYGVGANGKSTLLGVLLTLLGNYAMKAAPELLMSSQDHDRHPTERADLFGKRLVAAIETQEGRRINEALVKELTGGDPIRARRMREDFWEFLPTHKIVLATNHKPEIRGTDHAIWRRVKLIPFTVIIPDAEQDKDLPTKLLAELPGILAWMVRGCLDWQAHGLQTPDIVLAATAQYRKEQDMFEEFLETECFRAPQATCASAELYEVYLKWCQANDKEPLNKTSFGKRLDTSGFTPDKGTGGRRLWRGIGLPAKTEGTRHAKD